MKMNVVILTVVSCLVLIPSTVFAKNDKGQGKEKALPPGLQKNQERGKPLPPGWQRKLAEGDTLDAEIYAKGRVVVPLGKDGSISIEVEGTIIKLHEKTREIIKILSR